MSARDTVIAGMLWGGAICMGVAQDPAPTKTATTTATAPASATNPSSSSSVPLKAGSTTAAPATSMPGILVEDLPLDQQYVPTARPISSVYGTELSILDTPRSVSLITQSQLEKRGVSNITDLGQFSSGVYSPSRYGLAAVPLIRGDLGEVYQDNIRLRYNRNAYPVSFNGVESVDIVKGPGSVIYGPGSQVGGYVNFTTKQPYFDKWQGVIENILGRYVPGDRSYFRDQYRIDTGGPLIKDQLAMRISYMGRESDSWYQNVKDNTQDIFAAVSWLPNDSFTLDSNFQYYADRYNETIGLNRPTQDLIDNGNYITGKGSSFGSGLNGFDAVVTPTGTRHIYGYQTLVSPVDGATSQTYIGNLAMTVKLDDDLKITNRTLGESAQHQKFSAYTYTEYVPESITVDNRTEVDYKFETPYMDNTFKHEIITGIETRWERTEAYTEFFNENINGIDLTTDPAGFITPPQNIGGRFPIPGTALFGNSTSGNNNTGTSDLIDQGFFYQHRIEFDEQWALTAGGRADLLHAESQSLLDVTKTTDSVNVLNPSYNASVSYKPVKPITTYLTFNHTTAYGGGYDSGLVPLNGGGISPTNLKIDSDLYEVGAKYDIIPTKLFASVAFYDQVRQQLDRFNNKTGLNVHGIEVEGTWQPDKALSVVGNFTWQEANFQDLGGSQASTRNPGDFLTVGSPNFNPYPVENWKEPGIPNFLFNTYAIYTFDFGLGVGVGPQVQGEQNANLDGTLKIPAQFTWNATIFYKYKNWESSLNIYNFTDERNFTSVDATFSGNDLILEELPVSLEAKIAYRF